MPWRETLLLFIVSLSSVIQLCKGEGCKQMNFLPEDEGGYLRNHTIETVTADTQVVCRIYCYLSKSCTSYNYRLSTGTCEINDSDHVQHPGDLIRRNGFVYHSTENGCQTNPCPFNTTCKPNFISGGYRCLCPFDYIETSHIDCELPYQKVGCFKDLPYDRALPKLLLTYREEWNELYKEHYHGLDKLYTLFIESMRRFISRCAIKSRDKGFQVFGIQYWWECWSGPGGENSYSKHGEADPKKCDQRNFTLGCDKNDSEACYGLKDANYVYRLL